MVPPVHKVEALRAVWVCTLIRGLIGLNMSARVSWRCGRARVVCKMGRKLTFHWDLGIM